MTGLEIIAEIARLRRTPMGSNVQVDAFLRGVEQFVIAANKANAADPVANGANKPVANAANGQKPKRDRRTYMRDLMRKKRAASRA